MDTRWRYSLLDLLGIMALGIAVAVACRYLEPIRVFLAVAFAAVIAPLGNAPKREFIASSWCSLWLALIVCCSFAASLFELGNEPVPPGYIFAALLLACVGAYALAFFVYLRQTSPGTGDSARDGKPVQFGRQHGLSILQTAIQIGIPIWILFAVPDRLVLKWCYATLYQCIALHFACYLFYLADVCNFTTTWQSRLWILFAVFCAAATSVPK